MEGGDVGQVFLKAREELVVRYTRSILKKNERHTKTGIWGMWEKQPKRKKSSARKEQYG